MIFGLLSSYYDIVIFVVVVLYLCGDDLDKQSEFDQSMISYYDC